MKTIKKILSITVILIFIFLTIRCERADDIIPNYVGEWVFENSTSKIELRLNENSFEWFEYKDIESDECYVSFGDLIIKDLRMSFITNNVLMDTSISSSDTISYIYTEFIRGTDEFTDRFGLGLVSYDFDVADDRLILYSNSLAFGLPMIFNRKESNL